MAAAHAEGLQLAVHAIGDAAVRVCVKLYSRLLKKFPKEDHRHRLEHASVLNPALIRDIARLGLVVPPSRSLFTPRNTGLPRGSARSGSSGLTLPGPGGSGGSRLRRRLGRPDPLPGCAARPAVLRDPGRF